MIARDVKRTKLNNRYQARRDELRAIIANPEVEYDEKWDAMMALQKLPRDSGKTRLFTSAWLKLGGKAIEVEYETL